MNRVILMVFGTLFFLGLSLMVQAGPPLDFEEEPISYSERTADNLISRLQEKLSTKEKNLEFEPEFGYLLPLLKELKIPGSSQMLSFSKTPLQRALISPKNPRALYFNDDLYLGYVNQGVIEMIVSDPALGLVFYTLDQQKPAKFQRQISRCMTCHSSTKTKNIPGLFARSMFVDPNGQPVYSAGSFRTSQKSPLSERWGGWYVTGTHGKVSHLGNFHLPSSERPKKPIVNQAGLNVTQLTELTNLDVVPFPESDLVALLVFEHQIDAHNHLVRTKYAWEIDLHVHKEKEENARWKLEAEQLLKHLLFQDEAPLNSPIKGTSSFEQDFEKRGPFTKNGQSLRQFDLNKRIFRFPCSYMVHSRLFNALPDPVKKHLFSRMKEIIVLNKDKQQWEHLSEEDKQNLKQILPEVLPELKEAWR